MVLFTSPLLVDSTGGLYVIFNYADDNTLSENDKCIDLFIIKLEIISCKTITWLEDNCVEGSATKYQLAVLSRDPNITNVSILHLY